MANFGSSATSVFRGTDYREKRAEATGGLPTMPLADKQDEGQKPRPEAFRLEKPHPTDLE